MFLIDILYIHIFPNGVTGNQYSIFFQFQLPRHSLKKAWMGRYGSSFFANQIKGDQNALKNELDCTVDISSFHSTARYYEILKATQAVKISPISCL